MTRKFNHKHSLSVVVVPFIANLLALIAVAAWAQMPEGGQRFVSKPGFVADQHANALSGDTQAPVPLINLPLVPDAVAPGAPAFTLKVNGTGFVPSSVVNWNGSPRATTFVTSSQLTAKIAASDVATAGTAWVTVVSPAPGGGKSNLAFFPITPNTGNTALFSQGASLPTGEYADSVAVGDFNGDGNLDFAVVGWFSGNVFVYVGDGAGNFTLASTPSLGEPAGATSVAVGDFNGDGKSDLAVTLAGSDTVAILLGDGTGNFTLASAPGVGSYPSSVAVGDFNGDGHLDLAVAIQGSGTVSILLGDGTGNFSLVSSPAAGTFPCAVAVGDFNGDGNLDLAVANYNGSSSTVSILLGDGTGNFTLSSSLTTGNDAAAVAVSDFNGDGKLDLAGANYWDGTVSIFLGDDTGNFSLASTPAANPGPTSMAVGDFNADGKPDLAVVGYDDLASILLGDGTGNFTLASSVGTCCEATSVALGDFNGDGRLDIAVANYNGSTVQILLNISQLRSATTTTLASSPNPSVYGQNVLFSAAVRSASGTPTGTVIFYEGSTQIGSATLAKGKASLSTSSLAGGSQSMTAAYQGSVTLEPSTSASLNQVVNAATTTISLTSSANPAKVNKRVTYTATVIGQYGAALTGRVTFQDDGATMATVALSGNQAAYTTSYAAKSIHSITTTYSGDANNAGSMSAVLTEEIGAPFATKTMLTTSVSPSLVGQPVTLTAAVTSICCTIPNGELVTFYDGTAAIGTGTTASGVAKFTTSSLAVKTHTIKATYAGDGTFEPSTESVTQIVDKYPTTTALSSSLNPSNYGQTVTFTAVVTSAGPTPTGRLEFKDGTLEIGSATLSGGVAMLTKSKLVVGTHPIAAEYLGDAANNKSTSLVLDQVVQ